MSSNFNYSDFDSFTDFLAQMPKPEDDTKQENESVRDSYPVNSQFCKTEGLPVLSKLVQNFGADDSDEDDTKSLDIPNIAPQLIRHRKTIDFTTCSQKKSRE